jgi:spore germination protein Q
MNYNPLNYPVTGQGYYNFPAYRSFIGGTNPATGPGATVPNQGTYPQAMYPQQPSGAPMTSPAQIGPSTLPAPNQGTMQGTYPQAMYPQQMPPSGAPMISPAQVGPSTLPAPTTPGLLPVEQSYIENILRLNLGKTGTFYMTYENNTQWNAKIFKGRIEAAGRDHIIISDSKTGMRFLLLMVNLDYVTFDEELNYTYPYQQGTR